MLSACGHMPWSDRYGFRRQVALIDCIPDATQPDHPQVQDDLSALFGPRHPRTLEPLCEHNLARGLCDARADGQVLASVGLVVHPTSALFQIGVGLLIVLVLALQAALVPQRRCRLSDPYDP